MQHLRKLCAIALLSATSAKAQELDWTHFGLRPLGMGNAFVAVADDQNALFYNPAGLARLQTWDAEVINLKAQISTNTIDAISDLAEFSAGANDGINAVFDLIEKNSGKTHYLSLAWEPFFVMPNFGIGLGLEFKTQAVMHREIAVDLDIGPRILLPVAFAFNFLENRLSVGAGVKLAVRGGIDREFSINDISAFSSSNQTTETTTTEAEEKPELDDYVLGGAGIGADFGILFTPVQKMEPTIGISITDFGGTPYKEFDVDGEALGAPPPRLPSVNTGFSIKPIKTPSMYLLTAIDAHSVNQPAHYSKKFNLGAEWGFGNIIKLQTGLHQGELTAGFQFDVKLLYIRFATYAEQFGTYSGQDDNLRDRRYALQLKLLI